MNFLPSNSLIYQQLDALAQSGKGVVFSGLPGFGKSLYVQQFRKLADQYQRPVDLIQWDVARKAFESITLLQQFPMDAGTIHPVIRLAVGQWLLDFLTSWFPQNETTNRLLLIEAPLVGNRFVELVQTQSNSRLDNYLRSKQVQFVLPIPSVQIRHRIEQARAKDVQETATTWSGAKPSVMLQLYKMICEIAQQWGMDIDWQQQPEYDPQIV
ncbi:MAG: hypothetical protein AAGD05_11035, partial [Bacteroidota bacterium]